MPRGGEPDDTDTWRPLTRRWRSGRDANASRLTGGWKQNKRGRDVCAAATVVGGNTVTSSGVLGRIRNDTSGLKHTAGRGEGETVKELKLMRPWISLSSSGERQS
jgi:hypothetical protein